MPIISNFPTASGGSGGGGIPLGPVTGIKTLTASNKVYIKWTDPEDTSIGDVSLATWAGTLLVRKAGSMPVSRRDGVIVVDSKERNAYQNKYFCDNNVSNGEVYYYKFFPYSTTNTYTDDVADEFNATPNPVPTGDVSNLKVVAQLNERVQLTWNDPAETVVQDGITLSTWASTKVVYKTGSYPTSPDDGELAINSVTRNGYASSPLTVTGLKNGTTYYFALFPISTDGAVNTNTVGRITAVPNKTKITTVPSQKGSLTYNTKEQSPEWNNHNTAQLTLGGTVKGTDAGSYPATFTPTPDYCWSDGSTDPQTVNWTIGKANGTISANPASVTLNSSTKSVTVAITRSGSGTITATSEDGTVASVQVNGTNLTISSVNDKSGDTNIVVKVGTDKNYNSPADLKIPVSAEFIPAKAELNTMSWENIRKVSDAGIAATYWAVGDAKEITINGTVGSTTINQNIWAFILGFDHNKDKEGANRIHFMIGRSAKTDASNNHICFIDSTYGNYNTNQGSFTMNPGNSSTSSNKGGWKDSHMRKTLLGSEGNPLSPTAGTFLNALPQDLRAVMKPVTKYSDNTGGGSDTANYVTETTDYLFLLAEFEVFGARTYANSTEKNYQLQYAYFNSSNSKVFYRHSATTSTASWWLRSVYASNTNSFCIVYTSGSANYYYSGISGGVAPAFCV